MIMKYLAMSFEEPVQEFTLMPYKDVYYWSV